MPSTVRTSLLATGCLVASGLLASPSQADVTSLGDFTTSVPIEVPTFRGMQPSVTLRYTSGAGDGIVGVGWALDATSVIARTGPHGGIPPASFAATDRYTLDGEELVPCAAGSASPSCVTAVDTRGSSAGFYSTRRESFERLEHQGNLTPWTVWLTDGRTGRYETFDNGQTWLLTHSEDRHGNGMDYAYACSATTECELTSIRWGDNGTARGAEAHFYYENRPDPRNRGVGTGFVGMLHRLRSITVEVGGALVRAYQLAYVFPNGTQRSILQSVQQFGRDATVNKTTDPGIITAGSTPPLPPTTFTVASQSATPGWRFGPATSATGLFSIPDSTPEAPRHYVGLEFPTDAGKIWDANADEYMPFPWQVVMGDFDGDGRADIGVGAVRKKCQTVGIHAELTRKGGSVEATSALGSQFPSSGSTDCSPHYWTADVDGDHRDDVIFKFRNRLFSARVVDGRFQTLGSIAWTTKPDHCEVGDVDGDARDDFMCLTDQSGTVQLVTARSKGDGTFTVSTTNPSVGFADPMTAGDINGDGFTDIVFAPPNGSNRRLVVERSNGDGTYTVETQNTAWQVRSADELHATDVDGDGLSDLLLLRHSYGVDGGIALSIEGVGAGRFELLPLTVDWGSMYIGDVDGDGKADLVNPSDMTAAIGDGQGGFGSYAVSAFSTTQCEHPSLVDMDGDDRTDLLCFANPVYPLDPVVIDDWSSTRALRDYYRWMSGDFDGDGRDDYVYVAKKSSGIEVRTVLTSGSPHQVPWTLSPGGSIWPFDDSSTTHWMVADVGGPGGRADGRDDLVIVDTDGFTLRVYALLGNGDGTYTPISDAPWHDPSGVALRYPVAAIGDFFPLDVDGDGDTDLVDLLPSNAGFNLNLLRANGNGTWTMSSTPYFQTASPGFAAVTDFQPMEVNGDGLIDLVHVQSGVAMTGTVVRSLINRGDGTFTEVADTMSAAWLDLPRWRAIDLNGDGLTDLMHVRSATYGTSSGLAFDELLSRGDGTFQPSLYASAFLSTSDSELTGALEATTSLYPSDLDGNGLTDLLHISRYRDSSGARHTVLTRLLNPGPGASLGTWIVPTPTKVANSTAPASTPWAWRGFRDTTRPDSAGFMVFDSWFGATSAVYDISNDRLSKIDNGNGGTTDITYSGLIGNRYYLPASMLPIVTASVTRNDLAYSPPTTEMTTYTFTGAQWSDAQRHIGFTYVITRDPRVLSYSINATDDMCPGTTLQTVTFEAATFRPLGYTQYLPVAAGATAPFTCMVQQQTQYVCDPNAWMCQLQDDVQLWYDLFGNVQSSSETVANAPSRQVYASSYANEAAYIVDLPMYRMVYQDSWKLLALDVFTYDSNASYYAQPGPTAEVRQVDHWDDTEGMYVSNRFDYDPHGMLVRATDPAGGWTQTVYDAAYGAFPVSTCDPIGCTTTVWDTVLDQVVTSFDLNYQPTSYVFDAHGRVTQVTRPDGGWTRTLLLDQGRVTGAQAQRQRTRTEVSDGSAGDGVLWSEKFLDGWGRTYRVEHEGGAVQTREFDGLSLLPTRVSQTFATGSAPSYFTVHRYDAIGRELERDAPDGASRHWTYGLGTVEAVDELGHTSALAYDGAGEVIRVTERVNGGSYDTTYRYDAQHRLIGSTDPAGLVTTYNFDTLGRMTGETDPDRGTRQYVYRVDGQLAGQIDAKGQRIDFTYDATGRRITREDRDSAGTVQRTVRWTYDHLPGQGASGGSIGHVVRVEDHQQRAELASDYSYDLPGRLTVDRNCVDGACYAMRRSYDIAGRLARLTYPDASGQLGVADENVDHVYDAAGRLTQVGPYVTGVTYAIDGRPTQLRYGNGVNTDYVYAPARRWTDSVTIGRGSPIYQAGYTHDATGRIIDLAETAPTNIDSMELTYDELGRLTRAATTTPSLDRQFVYDSIGRITYSSKLGDYHYWDPSHPHAMTSADLGAQRAYDASGNATVVNDASGRSLKIDWTIDDRPAVIVDQFGTGTALAYDANGQRVKKDGPGGLSTYYGDYLAVENGKFTKYYFAADRLVARNDGGVAYYHQDHTHSTRVETDASGNVLNSYQYDVTGVPVHENEVVDDNIGFGGTHGDQELGLVYMNARYYDPTSARFISADGVVRDQFAPQSHDRYAYVENDPVNYFDPSGHRRRLVELMMEQKQHMRDLQVQWDASFDLCGGVEAFCVPGSSGYTIGYVGYQEGDSIAYVIPPGTDPSLAQWQIDQAMSMLPANQDDQGAGAGAHTVDSTTADAPSASSDDESGAGASTGTGSTGVRFAVMSLVHGASSANKMVKQTIIVPKGLVEYDTTVDLQGDLEGISLNISIRLDKNGKIVWYDVVRLGSTAAIVSSKFDGGDRINTTIELDRGIQTSSSGLNSGSKTTEGKDETKKASNQEKFEGSVAVVTVGGTMGSEKTKSESNALERSLATNSQNSITTKHGDAYLVQFHLIIRTPEPTTVIAPVLERSPDSRWKSYVWKPVRQ